MNAQHQEPPSSAFASGTAARRPTTVDALSRRALVAFYAKLACINDQSSAMNRDRQTDTRRKPDDDKNSKPDQGGDVQHIVDTGLPPGIDIEDVKDPGNSPNTRSPREKK